MFLAMGNTDPYNTRNTQNGQGQQPQTTGLPNLNQIIPMNSLGAPNMNFTGELSRTQMTDMLSTQRTMQGAAMGVNAGGALGNMVMAMVGMHYQSEALTSYYDYMNKVADNGLSVAEGQIELQEQAILAQSDIAKEQMSHEQALAKLQMQTEIEKTRINERGQNYRAGVFAATDAAFRGVNRTDWFYGNI